MRPYEYNSYENSVSQIPQQYQGSAARYAAEPIYQPNGIPLTNQRTQPKGNVQKPKQAARMPKAQALVLAEKMKKGIIVASLLTFGTFSGLVAYRQATTVTQKTVSTGSSTKPAATATQDSSSGYFNQGSSTSIPTGSSSSSSSSSTSTNNNNGSSTTTTTAPSTSTTVS